MENKDNIWDVIVRYLDNTMTGNDSDQLETWLNHSNENRRILHSVDQIWKASSEKSQENFLKELNLEKDWDRMSERIDLSDSGSRRSRIQKFRRLRKRQQIISNLLKVAALILVAFTSVFLTLQYAPVNEPQVYEPVFKEIFTKAGERANVDLGDGTKVFLNADSKLTVPDTFSPSQRVVQLSGQAFFDVTPDKNRPFYIETNNAVVEVVGTAFDVKSYDDDEKIRVVVQEGTVELKKDKYTGEKLIINQGYLGSLNRDAGEMSIEMVDDVSDYTGWKEGRLIFKNTPFEEVLAHIKRWYDVDVNLELSNDSLMEKEFTADLKTRSVADVFDVISMSMNIEYDINETKDTITVRNK
ncbi:FecR family protein [Rhodohalobacter sp. 614A]|uniref:FecR family protein n=1 Tax=Rhodohalobacter sp. 614A TaxID=2908649 RepID=UPI001F42EA20|nr:FecR family protein [Rhodohalobacter sp. 614A]